ncbi:hypothetical protein LPMP_341720 [Leishmania panamensis]|uniref:Uncharacterized protein n=1 Tax=Leishmania panamensis TaxID=5679 RepID=A0A088S0M0_LEIPA|nr:hypothetical protein LPMP_341720 [Leishmania panamensis]AIO01799.1 hypothetical protein LPMP_341720 [Leishmania panamensis]
MLLQDDLTAQQLAVISRVALLLQQVTLSTAISKPTYGIGALREVGETTGATVATLPGLKTAGSGCGVTATQIYTNTRDCSANGTKENAADRAVLQKPLQIPLVNTDESVNTLRQLGWLLDEATQQLQASVDAQLVDFYAHLRGKASATLPTGSELKERVTLAHGSRQDRLTSPLISRALSRRVPRPLHLAIGPSWLNDDKGAGARTESAGSCTTFPLDINGAEEALPASNTTAGAAVSATATPGVDCVRTESPFVPLVSISTARPLNAQQPQRCAQSRVSSSSGLHNAPMARRLEEERAAASELQSFFSLLLEAALRLSGASAAAVYMDDALPLGTGGAGETFYHPTTTVAAASDTAGSGRAQFLHCVAHSRGHFPSSISYATSNVLTTVVTTGVAVNVHYSESSLLHFGTSGNFRPGASDSGRHSMLTGGSTTVTDASGRRLGNGSSSCAGHLFLDMYNGVIVPIKGIGCLVLANKVKTAASDVTSPRFSIFDEHVAWSVALLSEAILHQYERQLLLRASWSPSCVNALRPYIQENGPLPSSANRLPARDGASVMRERRGLQSRVTSKRLFTVKSAAAAKLSAVDVDNVAVSSLVFDPQNDIFSRTLTMVRTGDPQVLKALPPELRAFSSISSSRRAVNTVSGAVVPEAVTSGSSAKLNDEEVFQAAAQYITNLESLWRRTISESNTMRIMVENYNKEMQRQEETIALLEAKVRELNVHMAQLERRGNGTRLSAA